MTTSTGKKANGGVLPVGHYMSSIMPLSPSLDMLNNIMESTPSFYKGVVTQQSSN